MKYSLCDDFLNANKIIHPMFLHGVDYLHGVTDFFPWSVEIHPTAKCNHRCIHCSYKARNASRVEMDEKIFFSLLNDLIHMKVKGVYFSGGGEPCTYSFLPDAIEKLNRSGVEIALISNGTLLEASGVLEISNRINYIALSVPSCRPEIFKKITGTSNLEKLLELPQKIKNRHGESAPIVGARVVITNLISDEISYILETLQQREFDYVLFKVVRDYENRGLGISDQVEGKIKNEVDLLERSGKIDSSYTNLNRIFTYRKPYHKSHICHTNQMGLLATVTPEGDVYPNIAEIGKEKFLIGNLKEKNFCEIWNGAQHEEVKKHSNKQWREGICKNCRAISYNVLIEELLNKIPREEDPFV